MGALNTVISDNISQSSSEHPAGKSFRAVFCCAEEKDSPAETDIREVRGKSGSRRWEGFREREGSEVGGADGCPAGPSGPAQASSAENWGSRHLQTRTCRIHLNTCHLGLTRAAWQVSVEGSGTGPVPGDSASPASRFPTDLERVGFPASLNYFFSPEFFSFV